MTTHPQQCLHLLISGRVQGVAYRASARYMALDLELVGWVRNRHSGEVEALIAGSSTAVEAFLAWAWQGPTGARVDSVQSTPRTLDTPPGGFEILPTA